MDALDVIGYWAGMRRFAKLLLLLSVLLMPLGMGTAAAFTAAPDHHGMSATQMLEHCPDQSSKHDRQEGVATCSMACASALPAQDAARRDPPARHSQPIAPSIGRTLISIEPEIVTPPPKFA